MCLYFNSNACPGGVSYRLLKAVCKYIVCLLNFIFQQSLFGGFFPTIWKYAMVIPLYKGKGDASHPSSYQPISLCSCLGKILEKVAKKQLVSYLDLNQCLHAAQHRFISGRSTVTSMLACDAIIADCINAGHPYDIIFVDFATAFDKVPHAPIITALSDVGICGTVLSWFASFLSGRTQQFKIGDCVSSLCCVTFGVVQGSIIGPALFTIFIDKLIRRMKLSGLAFADDYKIIADVGLLTKAEVQRAVNDVAD